ncbi:MAG: MFS transporter [Vicinamibacterales bacterium]
MDDSSTVLLTRTITKATWRLVPFLLLMYVLAFLDRANVGFAKESFQRDTGLGDGAYAFGAGVFFAGYALLEVPSNLILHRVGARIWMARIMVTWGLIAAAMMLAHTETTFYVLRLLLGIAEAGFFPGVILYLTYWFPSTARARVMGLFYFGAPLSFILGGPLSGLLLDMDGVFGLKGWQWMFLVEGLLATATGIWAFFYIDDRPAGANWLSDDEKRLLQAAVADDRDTQARRPHGVMAAFRHPTVWYLGVIYFLIQLAVYGVVFYLPTQVAVLLGRKVGAAVGLVTAIPWTCALVATYLIARHSDRTGERRWTASITLAVAGAGIAASAAASGSPLVALVALSFAAAGFISVQPLFWTFPTSVLTGTAAAGGIALVNSLGAAGGFAGPIVRTWAATTFGASSAGLYVLALAACAGAVLILGVRRSAPGSGRAQPPTTHARATAPSGQRL